MATYWAKGNHPALNDGKLNTVASVSVKNERVSTLKFPEVVPVRQIVIHNGNLYRFDVDYLEPQPNEWTTIHSVHQRRDTQGHNAQLIYIIDRLNL